MARVTIPLQEIPNQGGIASIAWTAADAVNHHDFDNSSGKVLLLARNSNAATRDVTVESVADEYGRSGNVTKTVAVTTGQSVLGPFKQHLFNQAGGKVNVNVTASAGLELAAVKIP